GFNTDELEYNLEYFGTAQDYNAQNFPSQFQDGQRALSNGAFRLTVKFRGKAVSPILPVTIQLPDINRKTDYNVYTLTVGKDKETVWTKEENGKVKSGKILGLEEDDCGPSILIQTH